MAHLTPKQRNWIRRSLLFLSLVALTLAAGMARAQQSGAHVWHPSPIAAGARPAPTVVRPPARSSVASPASAGRFASAPRVMRSVQPVRVLVTHDSLRPILTVPIFFGRFPFGGGFLGGFGFGYAGPASQSGEVPLGFGLWPACDSASIPGVFWSVGPCFGIGDYSAESAAGSRYPPGSAPPSTYLLPLLFAEEPQSATAPQQNPSAAAPAATMLLYLTDGSTIAASDWWVARGRLQYITTSGTSGSMDLSQLDLEQTITQNETRGLVFILRFTPPSDRYPPSERP